MLLNEALELHDTLNPKLWNEDNTLKSDVSTSDGIETESPALQPSGVAK